MGDKRGNLTSDKTEDKTENQLGDTKWRINLETKRKYRGAKRCDRATNGRLKCV